MEMVFVVVEGGWRVRMWWGVVGGGRMAEDAGLEGCFYSRRRGDRFNKGGTRVIFSAALGPLL